MHFEVPGVPQMPSFQAGFPPCCCLEGGLAELHPCSPGTTLPTAPAASSPLGSSGPREEGRKRATAYWLSEKLLVQVPTKHIQSHSPWLQLSAFLRMCISFHASIQSLSVLTDHKHWPRGSSSQGWLHQTHLSSFLDEDDSGGRWKLWKHQPIP